MLEDNRIGPSMGPEVVSASEERMVGQERWEEIRRLHHEQRWNVSQIARSLELDRKTVRRCLRQGAWQPYPARSSCRDAADGAHRLSARTPIGGEP
jgi:IS30 family transposase